jgi:transcriptional regulator with XRE-family HTH domain
MNDGRETASMLTRPARYGRISLPFGVWGWMPERRTNEAKEADKRIGERVRTRRLALSMSQVTFANAIGISFQQVQKYENGMNRIGGSRMIQVAAALQCEVAYLFPNTRGGIPDYILPLLQKADALTLLQYFGRIQNPEHRRAIVQMAEAMLAEGKTKKGRKKLAR